MGGEMRLSCYLTTRSLPTLHWSCRYKAVGHLLLFDKLAVGSRRVRASCLLGLYLYV